MLKKLILFSILLVGSSKTFAGTDIQVGDRFPEFTLRRMGQATHASISQFAGHPIVITFWANWCEPCKNELPVWNELFKKYSSQGLIVLGVNVDSNEKDGQTLLKKTKIEFTLLHDDGNKLADQSNLDTMPRSFILDKNGVVRYVHSGYNEVYDPLAYKTEIKAVVESK